MTFVLSRRSGERNAGAACVLLSSGASHISPSTGSWPDERVGEGLGLCSTVVGDSRACICRPTNKDYLQVRPPSRVGRRRLRRGWETGGYTLAKEVLDQLGADSVFLTHCNRDGTRQG